MQRVTKQEVLIWLPRITFFVMAAVSLAQYLHYLSVVIPFQYDWGPSDGDHLNIAHRLAQGLPIYLSMKGGQVLSIYTPFYHGLIALLGGPNASLSFAKTVSFLFWVLCPLTVFLYFRKSWGYFYATVAAIFIWLSVEPFMLMTAVYITPTTTMVFLFLFSLLYTVNCYEKKTVSWWNWVVLGSIAAMCYLAKQQGGVAIVIISIFLLIKRTDIRKVALVLLGFLLIFTTSTIYFEITNAGQYLNATVFDLKRVISGSGVLARSRLLAFLIFHNWAFTICAVLSCGLMLFRQIKLSIWHVSFILHIPFLLTILKNGGGGPDYFLTFWITLVLISVSVVKKIEDHSVPILCSCDSSKVKYLQHLPHLLLLFLLVNGSIAAISVSREINASLLPTPKLEHLMEDYYQSISLLVANKPQVKALTNRNIGALVVNNVNVENEGSTLFQYLWNVQGSSNRNLLLTAIRSREYDLITTGLQDYPEDVKNEIDANYKLTLTKELIFFAGNVGLVRVYIPK